MQNVKVVLLGDGRVGKTSLIVKYAYDKFEDGQDSTQNASFIAKRVKMKDNKMMTVNLWDTAGQEQFNSVAPIYYRDAQGAVVVYDCNKRESFQRMEKWIKELNLCSENKNIVIAIASNQSDLQDQNSIPPEEGQMVANKNNAIFYSTSAKTGLGINHIFEDLIEWINDINLKQPKQSKRGIAIKSIIQQEDDYKKKKDCC